MPKRSEELHAELFDLERRSAELRMIAAQLAEQIKRVKSEIAKDDPEYIQEKSTHGWPTPCGHGRTSNDAS